MNKSSLLLPAIAMLALASIMISPGVVSFAFATAAGNAGTQSGAPSKIPNQYIVILKETEGGRTLEVADEARGVGADVLFVYQHAVKGFAFYGNERALAQIAGMPEVAYVEQDQVVNAYAQTIPTGINRVDSDQSSALSGDNSGSVNVDIAIIDTGIDLKHPDLNVFSQKTFVKGTRSANDDNGHGTHVAGIAAAMDNTAGVVGMAPGARLWAVKVLDRTGSGSISTIIAGIDYVTKNAGAIDVANMSLGCECTSSALDSAITNSVNAGVTYVVAAGNSAKDAKTFSPANNPSVITVSAIVDSDGRCGGLGPSTSYGSDDSFATFSNFGSTVEIAAPGVNILSTYKGGSYATMSGTSMASPHVAGAAGLYKATHPTASPSEVRTELIASAIQPGTTCDTTMNDGAGYFAGGTGEPLLYAKDL